MRRRRIPGNSVVFGLRRVRRGLSLTELVVGMALAGVLGAVIAVTLTRQQRFFRGAAELHYVRENVRDALEVLSTDIRGMSVSDTVRLRADSAIEFFANISSSVVCQIVGNEVGLPSAHTSANSLSAFVSEPDTGDLAVFYGRSESGTESWERHRIAGFGSRTLASSCPAASGISQQSEIDAGGRGFIVTVATPLGGDVTVGSPVRFVRSGRYSLYNASDGDWYLGYRRCNAVGGSACGAIQPVSGAYRPYSSDPRSSGLLFEYFDATGQSLGPAATPLALARVDLTARSESAHQLVFGTRSNRISDSATVSLAIRSAAR
jgi:type II secretory pathway pseudopilin PulG